MNIETKETYILHCLYCNAPKEVNEESVCVKYGCNYFCSDKPCEDYYAQTQ